VEEAIDEAIRELVHRWKLTKMPVLEAREAYGIWTDAKKLKCRKQSIRTANNRIQELEERVFKMKAEFLKAGYPNKDCVRKVVKGTLEVTIEEMERNRWTIALLERPEEPTKPLPVGRKADQENGEKGVADDKIDGSGATKDGDHEILGSDSDTDEEPPRDEDLMNDFIVQDEVISIGTDHGLDNHDLDDDGDDDDVARRHRPSPSNDGDTDMKDSDHKEKATSTEKVKREKITPPINSFAQRFIDLTTPTPSPENGSRCAAPVVASKAVKSRKIPPKRTAAQKQRPQDLFSLPGTSADDLRYDVLRGVCFTCDEIVHLQLQLRLSEMKGSLFQKWHVAIGGYLEGLHGKIAGDDHEEFLQRTFCRLYIAWHSLNPEATGNQKVTEEELGALRKLSTFERFTQSLDRILSSILEDPSDTRPESSERHPKQAPTAFDEMDIDGDGPVGPGRRRHKCSPDDPDEDKHEDTPASSKRPRKRKEPVEEDTSLIQAQKAIHKNLEKRRRQAVKKGVIPDGKVTLNFGHLKKFQDIDVRSDIAGHLKPHQVIGIQFLWTALVEAGLKTGKTTGALLAHTMGLGKTLQV